MTKLLRFGSDSCDKWKRMGQSDLKTIWVCEALTDQIVHVVIYNAQSKLKLIKQLKICVLSLSVTRIGLRYASLLHFVLIWVFPCSLGTFHMVRFRMCLRWCITSKVILSRRRLFMKKLSNVTNSRYVRYFLETKIRISCAVDAWTCHHERYPRIITRSYHRN